MNLTDTTRISIKQLCLAIVSGVLIVLPFIFFSLYSLEWVAFIPLLFAIEKSSLRKTFFLSWLTGFVFHCCGYFWMTPLAKNYMGFTPPFHYLVLPTYALVMGFSLGCACLFSKWIQKKTNWDEIFILPWVFVFFWYHLRFLFDVPLATSQMHAPYVLQAIEFTGALGLDVLIIAINIALFKLLKHGKKTNLLLTGSVFSCFLIWMIAGKVLHDTWEQKLSTSDLKKIGIVQPNRIASISLNKPNPGFSYEYPWELHESYKLAKEGAQIIIWPEGHFFGYNYWDSVKNSFHDHFKKIGVDILFEDQSFEIIADNKKTYRTLHWINSQGEPAGRYHKNTLVPFGEYLPWYRELKLLYQAFNVPISDLTAGKKAAFFRSNGMTITPAICIESLNFDLIGNKIGNQGAGKVLVIVSQDGWYGDYLTQVTQHSYVTNLRAIENRVPLVHVITNGPSYAVSPTGTYIFKSPHLKRGSWVIDLPYSPHEGGSFYSRYPSWFLNLTKIIVIFLFVFAIIPRPKKILQHQ